MRKGRFNWAERRMAVVEPEVVGIFGSRFVSLLLSL